MTESLPKRATARLICRVRLVVFPVPGGPKMRYSAVAEWSRVPIAPSASSTSPWLAIVLLFCAWHTTLRREMASRQQPATLVAQLSGLEPYALSAEDGQHCRYV